MSRNKKLFSQHKVTKSVHSKVFYFKQALIFFTSIIEPKWPAYTAFAVSFIFTFITDGTVYT